MSGNLKQGLLSLDGLSVGDAFGEQFFKPQNRALIGKRELPSGTWRWTDDTAMAISITEVLREYEQINQDALCQKFVERFLKEPGRGYGTGAVRLFMQVANGGDWRILSPALFNGGSYGNGAAMRVAPLGGFFINNPRKAAEEAKKSAQVTHRHREGWAGAVAVAVAASLAESAVHIESVDYLQSISEYIPDSDVRTGIRKAMTIPGECFEQAKTTLGTGSRVSAADTVPFCLWVAAHFLHSYEDALWTTVAGLGDRDTTCAIVGGIVALASGEIPENWLLSRESLVKI